MYCDRGRAAADAGTTRTTSSRSYRRGMFWSVPASLGHPGYWSGRRRGRALLERGVLLASHRRRAQSRADRCFARHDSLTVFAGRFVPGVRVVTAVLAGATQLPWWRFALWNALGALAWATVVGGDRPSTRPRRHRMARPRRARSRRGGCSGEPPVHPIRSSPREPVPPRDLGRSGHDRPECQQATDHRPSPVRRRTPCPIRS